MKISPFFHVALAALTLAPPMASRAQDYPPPLANGTLAPAFSTKTIPGKPLTLRSLRGKVVLLDYWATWCGPCRESVPMLQSLHKSYAGRGLRVVGMSLDREDSIANVKPFVKYAHLTYTVTASPVSNIQAAIAYRISPIPTMYLIDKTGHIRWSSQGYDPAETPSLRALIQKLLKEKA